MTRKRTFTLVLSMCLAMLLPWQAALAYDYTMDFCKESSITSFGSPTHSFPDVTSAFNQPRTSGSNPHEGVDLGVDRVAVYPIASGTVAAIGYEYASGNYVYINHANGLQSRYLHLNSYSVSVGTSVNVDTQIGVSGNTGPAGTPYHLDFRIKKLGATYPRTSTTYDAYTSPYPHYTGVSLWNYGQDLAFIKAFRVEGGMAKFTIYSKEELELNNRQAPLQVVVFTRSDNSNTWDSGRILSPDPLTIWDYTVDLASFPYPSGTLFDFLIRASRADRQPAYNYAWDAPGYYQPDPNPNNWSGNGNYYVLMKP